MSPKKKGKAPEAQKLIDSLLDERTPSGRTGDKGSLRLAHSNPSATMPSSTDQSMPGILDADAETSGSLQFADQTRTGVPDPIAKADAEARAQQKQSGQAHSTQARSSTTPTLPSLGGVSSSQAQPTKSKGHEAFDQVTATADGGAKSLTPQSLGDGKEDLHTIPQKQKPPSLEDFTAPMPATASRTIMQNERLATKEKHSRQSREQTEAGEPSTVDRLGSTELKTVVKMRDRPSERPSEVAKSSARPSGAGPSFMSADAQLKQSESLRIAQSRITELEQELERLRRENEQLATAGETLRRRTDELISKVESVDIKMNEAQRIYDEERKVTRGQLHGKDRENGELKGRIEEMEGRLESNFKKIRVRERELEHRLEIVRMESTAMVATKDKMILDLKRRIDQLMAENESSKQKQQELFNQYKAKQETIQRVVRALRIALTQLEGDEDGGGIKKAE